MVDSEYSTDIYRTLNISVGIVMTNPEMIKFVPNHPKAKKLYKHAVKKLPFLTK